MPNAVLTCPGGWLEYDRSLAAGFGREHRDQQSLALTMHHTVASGRWAEAMPHSHIGAPQRALAGGGGTQGACTIRPASSAANFDATKHSWHHPAGQAEVLRLADQKQPGSWAKMMHKARDHNGYGDDGIVDARDVQITAVSGDAPDWFNGTRTLPGPRGTKKHPVRRCPFVQIEGKTVKVRARTYSLGDGLSTVERYHERPSPPTPAPGLRARRHDDGENKAKRCNLELGGCQTRPDPLPASGHVSYDSFQPPRMRGMAVPVVR